MDGDDEYAAAQISALTDGYNCGLRVPNPVCPWSNTDSQGWEWEFGCNQDKNVRNVKIGGVITQP